MHQSVDRENKPDYVVVSRLPETTVLIVAFAVTLLIAYLSYKSDQEFRRAEEQRIITQNILDASDDLLSALRDAETGQRGFLLTGDENYLDPYTKESSTLA